MTEAEWLACTDPTPMLEFLEGKVSDRKKRLYSCACVRAVWTHLKDNRSREAVELAERHADVPVPFEERQQAIFAAYHAADGRRTWALWAAIATLHKDPLGARRCAPRKVRQSIVADLFGNPFRPVFVEPSWLSSNVVTLAEGIYQDRAFDRMPILADALQDAGCDNEDILNHCRDGGVHVRGCWAVDLVLGKG